MYRSAMQVAASRRPFCVVIFSISHLSPVKALVLHRGAQPEHEDDRIVPRPCVRRRQRRRRGDACGVVGGRDVAAARVEQLYHG